MEHRIEMKEQGAENGYEAAAAAPRRYPGSLQDRELRRQAKALWREAARARKLSAESCAAYHLLLGGKLEKAFVPVSNAVKLANGADPCYALKRAKQMALGLGASAWKPWEQMLAPWYAKESWNRLPKEAAGAPLFEGLGL